MKVAAIIALLVGMTCIATPQPVSRPIPPVVVYKIDPVYTQEAIEAKLQGTVLLRVMVGTDGIASDIEVIRKLGKGLDEKAVECVQAWRFKPASLHGEPIPMKASIELNFRLPESK